MVVWQGGLLIQYCRRIKKLTDFEFLVLGLTGIINGMLLLALLVKPLPHDTFVSVSLVVLAILVFSSVKLLKRS
jgi:hypothetical protein